MSRDRHGAGKSTAQCEPTEDQGSVTMQWTSWLQAIRKSISPSANARRRSTTTRNEPAETLEDRSLLSVSAFFIGGQLSASSDGSDNITIRPTPLNPNLIQVLANGTPVSSLPTIQANTVSSIVVTGGDGPNTIDLSLLTSATQIGRAHV